MFYLYVNNFYYLVRLFYFTVFLVISMVTCGQTSLNTSFLDNWQEDTLVTNSTQVRYNDCWGYVQNGQEYAIAGSTEGIHFFRITDDNRLEHLDFVEGKYNSSMVIHRDIKVYQNYAYAVCDEGHSSLQIIDMSYLPDSVSLVAEDDSTFGRVHNLFIDEDNAMMYACSVTPFVGGIAQGMKSMEVFSLADPLNPVSVYTGPLAILEVHDAYVRNNIAYLNCGFDGLRVYDFTNPSSPSFLHNLNVYQEQGYNHQGWLTPDGSRYVFGDETNGKRLKLCSVSASHEPTILRHFGTNHENGSVPHNIMLSNDFAYVAYYNEGLRIYDIRSNDPVEIAHYDTYPDDSPFQMNGAWGMYSQLPSGRLLVSDRQYGLFLFDFREDVFAGPEDDNFDIFPNPVVAGDVLTIKLNDNQSSNFTIGVANCMGQPILARSITGQTFAEIRLDIPTGVYFLNITYDNYLGESETLRRKIMVH